MELLGYACDNMVSSLYNLLIFNKMENTYEILCDGNKIAGKNILFWGGVLSVKMAFWLKMVIRSYRWQVLQVENSCVNGTDIK